LAAITRNRANDYHRQSRITVEFTEDAVEHKVTGGRTGNSESDAVSLLSVIRSLPDAYRETLMLRLVEGLTGPEIAERTGLTPGSVRVNLHRGMKQLRETLGVASSERQVAGENP
jgi:RNA polymerase sigma-70 factor, ECF subfamily